MFGDPRKSVASLVDMARQAVGWAVLNLECELVISSTSGWICFDGITWRDIRFIVSHVLEL